MKGNGHSRLVVLPASKVPAEMVEDYLAHCSAANLSLGTIRFAYGYPLKAVLLPWLAQEGVTDLGELSQPVLDRLNVKLLTVGGKQGRPLSPETVKSYMRSVNVFLTWAQGRDRAATAQYPITERKLKEILTRDEIDRLENAATTERDKLIVRVLADTGMRVEELCKLRATDLLREDRMLFLHVRGKGRKDRRVPIPALFQRMQRLAKGRPVTAYTERLFIGLRKRKDGTYHALTPSGVRRMLLNVMDRSGIGKHVNPHLFRHTFATWMLSKGVDSIQVAHMLGHEGLEMVNEVYEHLQAKDAYAAMLRVLSQED